MIGRIWGSLTKEERKDVLGGAQVITLIDDPGIYFYNLEKGYYIRGTECKEPGQRYGEYSIPNGEIIYPIFENESLLA